MDRNTVIGFILIALVLLVWMWTNAPPPPQKLTSGSDSLGGRIHVKADTSMMAAVSPLMPVAAEDSLGKFFSSLSKGQEKFLTIETDNYRAVISTKGGQIRRWILKHYKTWDQNPVDLLNDDKRGDFNLLFYTADGKLINTKNLCFESKFGDGQIVQLTEKDSAQVDLIMKVDNQSHIVKRLTFYNSSYSFDAMYLLEGMQNIIANYEYQVTWETGLRYPEHNSIDESKYAMAYAFAGGELTDIDAANPNTIVKNNISGKINWVAARNKYFAVSLIPKESETQGAYLEGNQAILPHQGAKEDYSIALKMPFLGKPVEKVHLIVFLGPLDFSLVKSYHVELERIISLGAAWIIRPISEYVIIPLFQVLRLLIPNYGFILIIFSFIIKIVLHPLTKRSMRSTQRMQALQPLMNEIKEKYKDDPQKMNQQIMRLYKEYGVNPAGGCLPMLLQLPILYALWAVFSSTIELRQASFIWWIHDLSVPDVITKLPFRIPIFGVDEISGLALLMGITMFVQQKMSVKDPRQKMMVWLMPIMLTLLFNSFPAGLNLYYLVFNLLSIAQQAWILKQHKDEPLRKVEPQKKTGGFLRRLTKDLPQLKR